MSSAVVDGVSTSLLTAAHQVVDGLLDVELDSWTQPDLLQTWREMERLRNRWAAVEHRFVAQAEARGLPFEHGAKDTATFLRGLLRLDPYDAAARVRAADAAASRTTVTGQVLPAPFAHVAAAQAAGVISPKHASVVVQAVDRLTPGLQAGHGDQVEADLVGYAARFDPAELATLAMRATTLLDQDGALETVQYRERRREVTVHQRPDGSSRLTADATAELTEKLLTVFDALAKPKPALDGVQDPRSPGQRRHDALIDALDLVQRAELLPDAAGIATTVILTTTRDAWDSQTGCVTTGHGAILPVGEAIRIAGTAARVTTVELDRHGKIVGWTDARRLHTESQRIAMIARDGGCSFPGCHTPPAWCQAAHITDHARGGPTTVTNGTLLCGHHHRTYQKQGWRVTMLHGRPAWIPPPWLDPDQKPRTNHRPRSG